MEILFALVLFGLVSSAMFPSFLTHIQFNNRSEVRTAAHSAAQILLDELRLEDPGALPDEGSDDPVLIQVGQREFSVVTSYCVNEAFCTGSETRHITVSVSYNDEILYSVETVYAQLR
jgi:type II secretory pathway pseudopilin PulG